MSARELGVNTYTIKAGHLDLEYSQRPGRRAHTRRLGQL